MEFDFLIKFGEKKPHGVVYQSNGYWNANSVSDALNDILKRAILDDVNISDKFLLQIIKESFQVYGQGTGN